MSGNVDPVVNEGSVGGGEVLVDASGTLNSNSSAFPWVDSSVLTRTSIFLSPESLTPFRTLVRSRFPKVSKFVILEPPAANNQGDPKFPLYWTKNPNRLKAQKESSLTELELLDVKLLTSLRSVDCNVLIEKEGDDGALQPYIVEMSSQNEGFVPQMDAKAMKAFSRTNKRKQGSQASGPVLVTETEHEGFEGQTGSEVTSVFDRRFPTEQLVRSHFCKADNFIRIQKVGMQNTAKMVQVFTTQTAFLGHALETGIGLLEKELKEKTHKLKTQEVEVSKAKEVLSELESLGENFRNLSLEKEKVESKLANLKNEKVEFDDLLTEKTKLLEAAEEKLLAEQKG
ncbi:hypothetical protein SESBI_19899 [Sesbania bispinosa]|nr:hypothetical protein SESBI_19899 [Sesbania bispinosa]